MSMATNPSIWKREFSIVMLNAISEQTLVSHLGIEFTEFGEDYLSASMPVEARTRQPLGKLHGGAAVVLAETLASTAASLCVDGTDKCVGIEINANHIRSVTTGSVTGTTRPIHIGGSTHVWETVVKDQEGRVVSVGRMTIAVLKNR